MGRMGVRGLEGILLSLALALPLALIGPEAPLQGLPEGEVKITTDKLCYRPGESVHITAAGWARLPSIGDFPDIFWAVTDWRDNPVFETFNPADVVVNLNGTLTAAWNQTYRLANGTPPSGDPVPPGGYSIWFYMIPPSFLDWPFWEAAMIVIGNCDSNLKVLTDKDCYSPGEQVNISVKNGGPSDLGWGIPEPWFAVYDSDGSLVRTPFGAYVAVPSILRPNETYSRLKWNQTYKVIDILGHIIPPSYQQVPEGAYAIFSWAGWPEGVAGTKKIRILSNCGSTGPIADAGPDQTAGEGEAVKFDGSQSQGGGQVGQWEPRANMTPPGCCGAAAVLNDELYHAGGPFSDVPDWNKAWMFRKYTPANDSWTELPPMPGNREGLGAASVNGKLYAIGGWNGWFTVNTTFEFDPATNSWTERADADCDGGLRYRRRRRPRLHDWRSQLVSPLPRLRCRLRV